MTERLQIDGPRGSLDVEVSGPDDGRTVVSHSGTPAAGTMFAPMIEIGADRGLRHVAYSRPGYRRSARAPGRSVADCAADVAAVADALGIERFFTIGRSGGGPHSLACAALLPDGGDRRGDDRGGRAAERRGPRLARGDGTGQPGRDRRALTGAYADHLAQSMREALERGVYGWFDDDMAFIRDWGFDDQPWCVTMIPSGSPGPDVPSRRRA